MGLQSLFLKWLQSIDLGHAMKRGNSCIPLLHDGHVDTIIAGKEPGVYKINDKSEKNFMGCRKSVFLTYCADEVYRECCTSSWDFDFCGVCWPLVYTMQSLVVV